MRRTYDPLERLPLPLKTDRLLLEPPSLRLVPEYKLLLGDRDVSKWLLRVPFPYREEDARAFVRSARHQRREGTALSLAVREREGGRLVGGMGLRDLNWTHRHGELTYWFGKEFWGRGYASEAAAAVLDAAFGPLSLHRVEAGAFADNLRSHRVLTKAGFVPEGTRRDAFRVDGRWKQDRLFGLIRTTRRRRRVRSLANR